MDPANPGSLEEQLAQLRERVLRLERLLAAHGIADRPKRQSRAFPGVSKDRAGQEDRRLHLFELTRQRLGRSTVLHLPRSDFRCLHFRVAGLLRPEDFGGLSVEKVPVEQPVYVMVAESNRVVQRNHRSVIEFTVPADVPGTGSRSCRAKRRPISAATRAWRSGRSRIPRGDCVAGRDDLDVS